MKGRPPKLDLEKLKLNKENSGDYLEALKSRWEHYEDLRKSGEMPTSFIALEVISVIAATEEHGFSEEQIQSTFPKEWGAETINIPVSFLNVIRDCWWRYRDSKTLLLGKAFGIENLNRQGSHPVKSKISTIDLHRKYARCVIREYYVPDQEDNPRALIDVYADVAADLGVSIDTVKAAYLKYSPKIIAGLKEKGIILDD
ncbi:hypothetical protein N8370_07865 [Amylibacter sp.]|nr:hypothetical protein [Amylibacter sp.]